MCIWHWFLKMPSDCDFLGLLLQTPRGSSQSHNCCNSCNLLRKMEQGKMEDKRGNVTEVDGIQNLGRSKMFSCMRRDISVCVMVVV